MIPAVLEKEECTFCSKNFPHNCSESKRDRQSGHGVLDGAFSNLLNLTGWDMEASGAVGDVEK